MEQTRQCLKYISKLSIVLMLTSCCHIPLIECFSLPKYRPNVIIDSSSTKEDDPINSYAIHATLFDNKKTNENSLSLLFISKKNTNIFSYKDRNYYFLDNEKIYSDTIIHSSPNGNIWKIQVQIEFKLSDENLRTIMDTKNLFITEIMTYDGIDTVWTEIPYWLDFDTEN